MVFIILIYLAFVSLGLPDSLVGAAWPIMHRDLGVSVGNAGLISLTVSCGTIFSSLFSQHLLRKFGTGKVAVVSVALTAVALLGSAMAPSFWGLILCAVPLGVGAGAIDAGLNAFVAKHYAARHMNWLHCAWGVGTMLGPVLVSTLSQAGKGWRSGFLVISIIQFVLTALFVFSLPTWKKYEKEDRLEEHPEGAEKAPKVGILEVLRTRGAAYAVLTFFIYVAAEGCVMLWGASYLVSEKGMTAEAAAGWVSMFFVGITAGRALSGFLSMRMSNETMVRLGLILLLVGVGILLLPLPSAASVGAYVLIGLGMAPVFPAMLHQTPVYFGNRNAQAAMGVQMACAYTGSMLMPPLLGRVFSGISFNLMPVILLVMGGLLLFFTVRLKYVAEKKPL